MSKKMIRFISIVTLGWVGVSNSKPLTSNQFGAIQSDEINQQQKDKMINKSWFPGQCDDAVSGPRLLTDDLNDK